MASLASSPVFLVVVATTPAVLALAYYLRLVRRAPEPWSRVLFCCIAGGVSFVLAAQLQRGMRGWLPRDPTLWAFAVVAPSEELLKLAAVLVAAPWPSRYERVSSGLMYGVAAGAAFACVENVAYVSQYGALTGLLRAATAVPAHVLHSAVVGLGLGMWSRAPTLGRKTATLALAWAMATLLHGAYDAVLVGVESLRGLAVLLVAAEAVFVRYAARSVMERDLHKDMDLLAAVPMFDAVPAAALRIVAAGATRQRVPARATVVRQGYPGDAMFQIMRGELEAHVDGQPVARMGAGDFFGELALLLRTPRTADVVATRESLVLRVPRALLLRAVRGNDELARTVVARARERFDADVVPTPDGLLKSAADATDADHIQGLAARLATTDILSGLPARDLDVLASACVTVSRGAATRLVRGGRSGPGLCILLAGQATVTFEAKMLAGLAEGDFFGEISLLTGWGATATVTATTQVELAALRWIDLAHVLAPNPEIGWQLLMRMKERVARERGRESRHDSALALFSTRVSRALHPLDGEAATFFHAFPQAWSLPTSVVETIVALAEPSDGPLRDESAEPGRRSLDEVPGPSQSDPSESDPSESAMRPIWFQAGGGLDGSLGRFGVVDDGERRWWRLSREAALDGIARCPEVVRFLGRLMLTP